MGGLWTGGRVGVLAGLRCASLWGCTSLHPQVYGENLRGRWEPRRLNPRAEVVMPAIGGTAGLEGLRAN